MKTRKQYLLQNLIYAIIWLVVFALPIFFYYQNGELSWIPLRLFWVRILPFFLLFLIHNYLLVPRLLLRRRWMWYAGSLAVLIFALFSIVRPFVLSGASEPVVHRATSEFRGDVQVDSVYLYDASAASGNGETVSEIKPPEAPIIYTVTTGRMSMMLNDYLIALLVIGLNVAICYLFKSIRDDRQISELEALGLEAELNYLKAQINPHFFMNTLNNIHALIDIDAEKAKESVIELSKIMRYVLYEADMPDIRLSKEIAFIENYVGLMRIRFSDEIDIRMDFPDPVPEVDVPPMLLVTLVENAFKHGISYRRDSFIHTGLTVAADRLVFSVENSVSEINTGRPGVGMENMRKRLNLLFGENGYILTVKRTLEKYSVTLEIPIKQ